MARGATDDGFRTIQLTISGEDGRDADEERAQIAFEENRAFFVERGLDAASAPEVVLVGAFDRLRERHGGETTGATQRLVLAENFSVNFLPKEPHVRGYAVETLPKHRAADYYARTDEGMGYAALYLFADEIPADFDEAMVAPALAAAVHQIEGAGLWHPPSAASKAGDATPAFVANERACMVSYHRFVPSERGCSGGRGVHMIYVKMVSHTTAELGDTAVSNVMPAVHAKTAEMRAATARAAESAFLALIGPKYADRRVRCLWSTAFNTFAETVAGAVWFYDNCYHHHANPATNGKTLAGPLVVYERDRGELAFACDRDPDVDLLYVGQHTTYDAVFGLLTRGVARDVPVAPLDSAVLNLAPGLGGAGPDATSARLRMRTIDYCGTPPSDHAALGIALAKTLRYDRGIVERFPPGSVAFVLPATRCMARSAVVDAGAMRIVDVARLYHRTGRTHLAVAESDNRNVAAALLRLDAHGLNLTNMERRANAILFPVAIWLDEDDDNDDDDDDDDEV